MFDMDRTTYKMLVIGFGAMFIITPLAYYVVPSTSCGVTNPNDTQSIKDWRNSCMTWNYNMGILIPLLGLGLGSSIIILGFVRLQKDKESLRSKLN